MSYSQALLARGQEILERLSDTRSPVMAEIGVATGNLSNFLLNARPDLTLYMVDNWLPTEEQPEPYRATNDSNARHTVEQQSARRADAHRVARAHQGRTHILGMDSVKAAEVAPDGLDLIFLDGDHSYEGVLTDIYAWSGKIRQGGWFGGHDYANNDPRFSFQVKRAVDELYNTVTLGRNFTWWVRA